MEPDDAPLPPLPLGDGPAAPAASASASAEAFRHVLRRHRRRQVGVLAAGVAAALVGGSLAGFAAGRHGRSASTTEVAVAGPASTSARPAAAGVAGAASSGVAIAQGGQSGGGSFSVAGSPTPQTQLLVRDAADGTRVRLYEAAFALPTPACPTGAMCAQPQIAACAPSAFVTAEVSDDQVAGTAGGVLWTPPAATTTEVVSAQVVGEGQPQPILVVIGHAGTDVAHVTLQTAAGQDSATPAANGWMALAVRLPAGSQGLPTGTLLATTSSGGTVATLPLDKVGSLTVPSCGVPPAPVCNVGSASATAGSGSSSSNGGTAVQAAPAGSPCPPCVPMATPAPAPNSGSASAGSATAGVAAGSTSGAYGSGGPAAITCTSTSVSSAPATTGP